MKRTALATLFVPAAVCSIAQQWLVQGARWKYEDLQLGHVLYQSWYASDSIVDGYAVQVVRRTQQDILFGGPIIALPDHYYRMEGNAVMRRCGGPWCFDAAWDTTYFLGIPGDRWMSEYAEPSCYPSGMLQIVDTGHMVLEGIQRRTWDLVYLDENGNTVQDINPQLGDSLGIIEGVGSPPGAPPGPCDTMVTWHVPLVSLLCYSDAELSIPEGTVCDLVTSGNPAEANSSALLPNPGTDQFTITGLSPGSTIRVCDPLGRLIHSAVSTTRDAIIPTSAWEVGTYYITVSHGSGGPSRSLRWVKT